MLLAKTNTYLSNVIESFSVDSHPLHVHHTITTTQLVFSGTVFSCVSDETYTVGFVAFDGEMTKLTKRTFSRSRSTYGKPERTLYNYHLGLKDPDQRPLPVYHNA
ncbi:hypothetical protein YC2023_037822 [Brassica napus]